jgi:peptidoglycan/xylan/chitin deacetylase (PgdA/CDA1 family)
MFHHFHGGGHRAGQGTLSGADFARMIDFIGRDRLLDASEWLERALGDRLEAGDLCLTFDDNLLSQYEVALPVLEKTGLTAFWFISTCTLQGHVSRTTLYQRFIQASFESVDCFYHAFFSELAGSPLRETIEEALQDFDPESYLAEFSFYTPADRRFRFVRDRVLGPQLYRRLMDRLIRSRGHELRSLTEGLWLEDAHILRLHELGHVIGLHSHTHPTRLAELSRRAQLREYAANQAYLANLLGTSPVSMSHPCNSYNETTLAILHDLGVRIGFRSNGSPAAHSPLEFPRQDCTHLMRAMQAG